ncbi:hypothetical protein KKE34_05145 [Patescibacteria group bacterium]|nr:hypothetical protein [Patescibacteria group bacterium]MBU1885961.1 hypothetical protein [Patescibacteria group bacterium]
MSTQTTQIKVGLSSPLHYFLQEKAKKYGLTMASYVRNLIIDDVKKEENIPVYLASKKIEASYKLALKDRDNAFEVDDLDVYFKEL